MTYDYSFGRKISEKHLDHFVDAIYKKIEAGHIGPFRFNLIQTTWISNQELLVFTGILYYLIQKKIKFSIDFFEKGTFPSNDLKKAFFLITLWENWGIYKILPDYDEMDYFGINENSIKALKKQHKIKVIRGDIYNSNKINTPFQILNFLDSYKDGDINRYVKDFVALETATKEIIRIEDLQHPFVDESLGSIIIKELYENFLDHFSKSFFNTENEYAFLSLSIHGKINESENSQKKIQEILKMNFGQEKLLKTKPFFYDKKKKKFKNQAYLEFSFLDFGEGISTTLKKEFLSHNGDVKYHDSDILSFAFLHHTSKDPIHTKHGNDLSIPRGLFDVIAIAQKYMGLVIARSNYGKIIYDYSEKKKVEPSAINFANTKENLFFPGTLISIYLPTFSKDFEFNYSTIKPHIPIKSLKIEDEKIINLFPILKSVVSISRGNKENLYSNLIQELNLALKVSRPTIIYLNFKGCEEYDERLLKKTVFYLLSDYDINLEKNLIIINPPSENVLENIKSEIFSLNRAIQKYVIHPLPLIYLDTKENIALEWLGVFNEDDKSTLNKILFGELNYSLASSDFINPDEIVGHINYFDDSNNLISKMPDEVKLLEILKKKRINLYFEKSDEDLLTEILIEKNCIKSDGLYLCSGNYYQEEYIQISNILDDKEDRELVSELIIGRINQNISEVELNSLIFISFTTSGHRILDSLKNSYRQSSFLYLNSYLGFQNEDYKKFIKKNKNYILVCDTLSTGLLAQKTYDILKSVNSELRLVITVADALDKGFEQTQTFIDEIGSRLISLLKHPIKKYRRNKLPEKLKAKLSETIRVNPYTNTPITFQISKTFDDRILIKNEDFVKYIPNDSINIGFKNFNNLVHPYFFNIRDIIESENEKIHNSLNSNSLLVKSVELIEKKFKKSLKSELRIFYPKNSDITALNFRLFKNDVLKNSSAEEYQIERFSTLQGWKFPHLSDYHKEIIENNSILILDDGSCTGDSLVQMINEVSYFQPRSIILLCIIGRVNDHKREFFSKLKGVQQDIPVDIFFSCYWHVPTFYLSNNPYSYEINWLHKLMGLSNTPITIKNFARKILNEIEPKTEEYRDYKYLITDKKTGEVPKKEIILARERIGRVIGYRYYKENFEWFNQLISKYENFDYRAEDRTKDMELICICILYEPYLYDEIKKVMPDVIEKIALFVRSIIFGNPENDFKIIELEKHLYYNWLESKKNIIHLFFVVFKDEELIEFFEPIEFKKLLEFGQKKSDIDYVLYKLTYFFLNDTRYKLDITIRDLLVDFSKEKKYIKPLRNFMVFLRTLPTSDDFDSQLFVIKGKYDYMNSDEAHSKRDGITFNISILHDALDHYDDCLRKRENISQEKKLDAIEAWDNCLKFLNPIISFARKFSEYISPISDNYLETIIGKQDSILSQMSFIGKLIDSDIDEWQKDEESNLDIRESLLEKITSAKKKLLNIENKLIKESSDFYNLIDKNEVIANELIKDFIDNFYYHFGSAVKNIPKIDSKIKIKIPKIYANRTILNELITNIKNHGDKNLNELKLEFEYTKNLLILNLENRISTETYKNSTWRGLKKYIKSLSDSELFDFKHEYYEDNGLFKQKLTFYTNQS